MGAFKSKDKGLSELMRTFKVNAGESHVFCGYLRSSGEYKAKPGDKITNPITVAQVAMMNEFGTETAPERSFIRSTMSAIRKKLKLTIKKLSRKIVDGKIDKHAALGLVGEFVITHIKDTITDGVPPPNAPSTVKAKGSDHTLIDTGQMRDSLDYEVKGGHKK